MTDHSRAYRGPVAPGMVFAYRDSILRGNGLAVVRSVARGKRTGQTGCAPKIVHYDLPESYDDWLRENGVQVPMLAFRKRFEATDEEVEG